MHAPTLTAVIVAVALALAQSARAAEHRADAVKVRPRAGAEPSEQSRSTPTFAEEVSEALHPVIAARTIEHQQAALDKLVEEGLILRLLAHPDLADLEVSTEDMAALRTAILDDELLSRCDPARLNLALALFDRTTELDRALLRQSRSTVAESLEELSGVNIGEILDDQDTPIEIRSAMFRAMESSLAMLALLVAEKTLEPWAVDHLLDRWIEGRRAQLGVQIPLARRLGLEIPDVDALGATLIDLDAAEDRNARLLLGAELLARDAAP